MKPNNNLLREYKDPLHYLDKSSYRALRRRFQKRGLTFIGIGLLFCALLMQPTSPSSVLQWKGNIAGISLASGLPMLGIYQLFTLNRSIIKLRQAQLVWLHPELRALEPPARQRHIPALGTRIVIDAIFIAGLVLAMTLFALYLANKH